MGFKLARERERWAREDAAWTFELRREAYMEFHTAVNQQRGSLRRVEMSRRQQVYGESSKSVFDTQFEVSERERRSVFTARPLLTRP